MISLSQLLVVVYFSVAVSKPLIGSASVNNRLRRDEESFIRWETLPTTPIPKTPPKVVFNILKPIVPEKGAQILCALPLYENYNATYPVNVLVGFAGPRIVCPIRHLLETVARAPINVLVGFYRPRILSPYIVRQEMNPAAELDLLTGFLNMNILNPVLLNQQLNPIAQIRVLSGMSNTNILAPMLISQTITPSVFVALLDGLGDGNILSPLLINMQIAPFGAAYVGDGIVRPNILSPQLISMTINPSAELNRANGLFHPTFGPPNLIKLNLNPSVVGTRKDKPLIDPQILSPSLINADPDDVVLPEGRHDPSKLHPTALLSINNSPKGLFKLPQILRNQPELYGIIKDLFNQEIHKAFQEAENLKTALNADYQQRLQSYHQQTNPFEQLAPPLLRIQSSFRLM